MKHRLALAVPVLVAAAACTTPQAQDTPVPTTAPARTVTETAAAAAVPPSTRVPAKSAKAATGKTLPNLTGKSMEVAESTLRALGIGSGQIDLHDDGPDSRTVLVARNWRVCSQDPAAGTPVTKGMLVTVGGVKFAESCP